MKVSKRITSIGAAALVVGAGLIGFAGSASAHTTGLTGAATCNTTTGTWSVTYTGTTSSVPAGKTGTVTATTPNTGATLVVPSAPIAANAGYTITETGVAPAAIATAQVDVHIAWSDGYSLNQVTAISVGPNCAIAPPPPSQSPSPTPTPTPQACDTSTYTATITPGSTDPWYTEDGAPTFSTAGLVYDDSASAHKINYFHPVSVPLAGIRGLGYTVNDTGGPYPAFDMEVDTTGTSGYTTLVYEPYLNGDAAGLTGTGAAVTFSDLEAGKFWSSHIPNPGAGSQADPITLADFDTLYPSAKIISYGVALDNAGSVATVNGVSFLCGITTFADPAPANPNPGFFTVNPVCGAVTYVLGPNHVWAVQRDGATIDNITGNATRTYTGPGVYSLLDNGFLASGSTVTVAACATPTPTPPVSSPPVSSPPAVTPTATPTVTPTVTPSTTPTVTPVPVTSPPATLPFTGASGLKPMAIVGVGLLLGGIGALASMPMFSRRNARHSA